MNIKKLVGDQFFDFPQSWLSVFDFGQESRFLVGYFGGLGGGGACPPGQDMETSCKYTG